MTAKCDLIFKMLWKHNFDKWDEECQITFDKVKEYLTNASVLVPLVPGKPLRCIKGQWDVSWGNTMKWTQMAGHILFEQEIHKL